MVVMIVFVGTSVCECMIMMHNVYSMEYVDVGLEKIMLDYFFFFFSLLSSEFRLKFMSTILYNCCSYMFGFKYIISNIYVYTYSYIVI